jgi:hypothetical protein
MFELKLIFLIFDFKFAWLGVIAVVITGVLIVLLLLAAIGGLAMLNLADNSQEKGLMIGLSVVAFVFLLVYIADFVLTVSFLFRLFVLI